MKIIKIKAKNFGSYGNQGIEIDFTDMDNSYNLILGKNGSGKSSLMSLFSFSLYGKVSDKKLKDIPNRLNEKCEVEVELISNGKHILIQRGLSPNYFKVAVDGNWNIGERAGKLNVQDYLEEELYNMPYHLFNNVISLSVNDFKSFIKMSSKDKIGIIDKIFGLSIINMMYDLLKSDIKDIKEQSKDLTTKTLILTEQIDTTTQELENLSEILTNDSKERIEEIKGILEKLKNLKAKFLEEYSNLNEISQERNASINDINKKIQRNNIIISKLDDKINLFKQEKCPECGTNLQDDDHVSQLNTYIKDKKKSQTLNKEYKDEMAKEVNELNSVKTKQDEVKSKCQKIDIKTMTYQSELNELNGLAKVDKQTSTMQKIVEDSKEKLEVVLQTKKKVENKQNFFKLIDDILGEKGIKHLAMKAIIPGINAQIGLLLKELGLEFKLEFNEEFDARITHFGKDISPGTLSAGENKKLDFAVIIAIIKIMKAKFPGLNLLFLDEILSSLDIDAQHHVLKILSKIAKEQHLHVFIVNHSPLDNTLFDYVYKIEKPNEFSIMTKDAV